MSREKKETVLERIGHVFDTQVFLMLMLCISYIMCYKFLIEDATKQTTFVNVFGVLLNITTIICIIYAIYQSIEVLRINHPNKIKPLVFLFMLFLSFFSIYNATVQVYLNGGGASVGFIVFVQILMKLFSILFFSVAISLTSYAFLLKSKNDKIKSKIMIILSLYLMVEHYILALHSTVTTYTSHIEILAVYYLSISVFNLAHMTIKPKDKKLFESDTILCVIIYVISIVGIIIRDYQKIANFFYANIFKDTYDIILNYTVMIILQFIFMLLVIKNYKNISNTKIAKKENDKNNKKVVKKVNKKNDKNKKNK